YMNYGSIMQKTRNRENISQEDIAKTIGISRSTYGHYETQYQIIPINHLVTFCNYFNISIDYIFGFTTTKNYSPTNQEINKAEIGKRLKLFRKENKLTQVKLASMLNTTQSVIADYERGRYLIATPFLYTICKKDNLSADYLLGRIDKPL
ncbi:MAG: helix-turn-helix domain-containing protein, partial [Bacilli bacterium]|nr:helix-turn-helix domain-containing protein [Bacilli bacterium]